MVIPQTAAEIERLLMRWPFSARLKYELRKAQAREARQAKRARAKLLRTIRCRLKILPMEALREVAAELLSAQQAQEREA